MTNICSYCGRKFDWKPVVPNIFYPTFILCQSYEKENYRISDYFLLRDMDKKLTDNAFMEQMYEIYTNWLKAKPTRRFERMNARKEQQLKEMGLGIAGNGLNA